jgi:SPP1 family predicted phage head-tail adaptor
MQGGKLRERVVIKASVDTVDSVGQPVPVWSTTIATVWGRAIYLSGLELIRAQKINAEISLKFQIRYRADVTVKHRVVWNGVNWNIHAVLRDDRPTMLSLMCSEVE